MKNLFEKYDRPVPRYTSYPGVPHWKGLDGEFFERQVLSSKLESLHQNSKGSLYIHLPFCESLCTFCGCTKIITKNHGLEETYVNAVLREWELYTKFLKSPYPLYDLHLGGGTPTFFSSKNLTKLVEGILRSCTMKSDRSFSFEAHPNVTSKEHLAVLGELGFRRVSFGVQDFDPRVQKAIKRIQSFETVAEVTNAARRFGFTSVNFDLVYGLPFQNPVSLATTIDQVLKLRPDRIAFYSYAHVPWIKPSQRSFSESDLPTGEAKRGLYEVGKNLLTKAGYVEVGMDHFALPGDDLFEAMKNSKLHRNFMGYTPSKTQVLIGLGMSAISDLGDLYVQNSKSLDTYLLNVENKNFPLEHGHELSESERLARQQILDLMCYRKTSFRVGAKPLVFNQSLFDELKNDCLIEVANDELSITDKGVSFLRTICSCFDPHLVSNGARFSQSI